jgi:protein-disulfide isomerase
MFLKAVLRGLVSAMPAVALTLVVILVGRYFLGGSVRSTTKDPLPPSEPQVFDGPTKGNPAASVGIIAYSEFQCPYCARFADTVFRKLDETYIKPGRVAFAFRHFPLEQIHPFAFGAASLALCSGEQGKFWDVHDLLFANQAKLGSVQSTAVGDQMGLDQGKLQACLADEAAPRIRSDMQQAQSVGLANTPSFLIGRLVAGKLAVTSVIVGARPFEDFAGILDPLLKTTSAP